MRRQGWGALALGGAALALGGCAGGPFVQACPAIGWSNVVTVELVGSAVGASYVELCLPDGCSIPSPGMGETVAELCVGADCPTLTAEPLPSTIPMYAEQVSDTEWTVSLDMQSPAAAEIRAFGADGAILAEEDAALEWVRVGGSEECGGPHEATVKVGRA